MNQDLDSTQRLIWRKQWIASLHGFTSLHEQELLWLGRKPGEMSSYVECMSMYFDDSLHGEPLQAMCDRGMLSLAEMESVGNFHFAADNYSEPKDYNGDDSVILSDPAWNEIVLAAQDAWARLLECIESEDEKVYMENLDARI